MLERVIIVKAYDDGYVKDITLLIKNGIVIKRYNYVNKDLCREYGCIDLSNIGITLPGFIDMHAHLRGLELSYKEDEESGTKAAARGGFTAVIDMPNTIPRIDNCSTLQEKLYMLRSKSYIDYGVYVSPSDREMLENMLAMEGVIGVKIFPHDLSMLSNTIDVLKSINHKKVLIIHAENPSMTNDCEAGIRWLCRPIESEISVLNIINRFINNNTNIKTHITHVTNVLTLSLSKKYMFTTDTCPHYLYLSSDHEKELKCVAKVNPPLRTNTTRDILVKMLKTIDAITSDHAPHNIDEKQKEFIECPPGIASIEIVVPLILGLTSRGIIDIDDVIRLLSKGPAKILGLSKWGCFYEGCIASYTVVNKETNLYIDSKEFFSKAKLSPYDGIMIKGAVKATIVRGAIIYLENMMNERISPLPITKFMRY